MKTAWLTVCLLAAFCSLALAGQEAFRTTQKQESAIFHGNHDSRIYHNSSCRYFLCKACTVVFASKQEAVAQGYRPCKGCGG